LLGVQTLEGVEGTVHEDGPGIIFPIGPRPKKDSVEFEEYCLSCSCLCHNRPLNLWGMEKKNPPSFVPPGLRGSLRARRAGPLASALWERGLNVREINPDGKQGASMRP
jgi:hypothetical protein